MFTTVVQGWIGNQQGTKFKSSGLVSKSMLLPPEERASPIVHEYNFYSPLSRLLCFSQPSARYVLFKVDQLSSDMRSSSGVIVLNVAGSTPDLLNLILQEVRDWVCILIQFPRRLWFPDILRSIALVNICLSKEVAPTSPHSPEIVLLLGELGRS